MVPELFVNFKSLHDTDFSTAFTNRASLRNNVVDVSSYSFVNRGDLPMLIKVNSLDSHEFNQEYENAISENRVRINSTQEWRVKEVKRLGEYYISPWLYVDSLKEYIVRTVRNPDDPFKPIKLNDPQIFTPPRVLGEYTNYNQEVVPVPSTSQWQSQDESYCELVAGDADDFTYAYNMYTPTQTDVFTSVCIYSFGTNYTVNIHDMNFEYRLVYDVEYESGYPRDIYKTETTDQSFDEESFSVFVNNTLVSPITIGDEQWYRIPEKGAVEVKKHVKLPPFVVYDHTDVGDRSTFSSYTTRSYDNSLSWRINQNVNIEAMIDDGDIDIDHTIVNSDYGSGSQFHFLSRP